MKRDFLIKKVLKSRKKLAPSTNDNLTQDARVAEGGCGVIGIACNEQIAARHLLQALSQMRNRGNGKGGGIAAVGLIPEEFGVSKEVLEEDYLLTIAYLDPDVRQEVEEKSILGTYLVDHIREMPHIRDRLELDDLDIQPPEVVNYFVRVRSDIYDKFVDDNNLDGAQKRLIEDEIVYQNSFALNKEFYASTGETRAFVLSHGKNMFVIFLIPCTLGAQNLLLFLLRLLLRIEGYRCMGNDIVVTVSNRDGIGALGDELFLDKPPTAPGSDP